MEQMDIEQSDSTVPAVTVFALKGPFTLATMVNFQATLRDPAIDGAIVDMSAVPYMDSAGLSVLLGQWAHAQRVAKKYALAGMSPRVFTIFQVTQMDKVLPIYSSVADAEKALT
jgi:anti-sigma B factor antagonist